MSRRTTLGPISPAQMNRGNSNAASRVAAGKELGGGGPASNAGAGRTRKSMLPTVGAEKQGMGPGGSASLGGIDTRRSSAYNKAGSGPKNDPRPITDKAFINNCIRTVITYLSTHGYPAAVAPKTLASPTAKDFTMIVQFLFQKFDPSMRIFGKIEDDVPLFFKRINYPFAISKSALFAVGSPHSWPAVLAALTWLVELLNYNAKVEEQGDGSGGCGHPGVLDDQESATKRQFFDYICTSYRYFLAGDDARCNAVDEEMLEQFRVKERAVADAHARIKEANERVVAEVQSLQAQPSPLVAAQARREERAADSEKFEKLIENLNALKVSLQRKASERQADVASKQEELQQVAQENEALRARVATQPVNKSDLNRLVMDRSRQREVVDAVTSQCEDLEAKVHQQEVQFVSVLKSLEASVVRYNHMAHRLKLVPASAKRADGVTYEMRINRDASTPQELSNVDLKGVVKPGLERLCKAYRTKATELGRDLLSLREAASSMAEACAEKKEENAAAEAQVAKLEAQLRAAREAQEEKVRAAGARAERLKEEVGALRSEACYRQADVEARKAEGQMELDALQRSCEAEIAKLRVDLRTALEAMLQHRIYVQQKLDATAAAVQRVQQEVHAMPAVMQ